MAAAGHAGDPRPRPARRPGRHDPAVPDVLGDLRRRAEGAPRARSRRRASRSASDRRWRADGRRDDDHRHRQRSRAAREPELRGQTVVVIGGSAGIGLETARRARPRAPTSILTGRNPERLKHAASERRRARAPRRSTPTTRRRWRTSSTASTDPIDHVMVTAGGPYYAPLAEMDFDEARRALQEHPMLMVGVARHAAAKVRPGGTLLFMGGTGGRRPASGVGISSAMTAALPAARGQPRARDRAGSGQPDRRRLRRHAAVGVAARRSSSRRGATSCARRSRSGAWSDRPTSPRWPFTSWPTPR